MIVDRDGKQRKEGSGASLQDSGKNTSLTGASSSSSYTPMTSRVLREIKLEEPIRYNAHDPVEKWLTRVLCLDACNPTDSNPSHFFSTLKKSASLALSSGDAATPAVGKAGCPHPDECELYYVNRDTLFSYHPVSEAFLQRMMSLYVAGHYKNSPNDLQLMR